MKIAFDSAYKPILSAAAKMKAAMICPKYLHMSKDTFESLNDSTRATYAPKGWWPPEQKEHKLDGMEIMTDSPLPPGVVFALTDKLVKQDTTGGHCALIYERDLNEEENDECD